ncbi:MAG: rod shape-determining protein MreD [Acidobacteriota bacterium]
MQIFKIIISIIILVAIQGSLSRYLHWFERVDLTLVLTVYLSLKRKPMQGTLVGAGAGLAYDAVSGVQLLGASGFTKTLIGFILSSLNVHFAIDRKLMRLFILVLASVANVLLFLGLHSVFNALPISMVPREIAKLTVWQAAGNLILGFFLFPILDRAFVEQPYVGSRSATHW